MSIQDTGGATYSDHEIQWLSNDYRFLDAADAGPDTSLTDESQFSVTERGLDNDELAELVYMRADIQLGLESVGDQTTRNVFKALTDFGANLSGTEFQANNPSRENFDVDSSGTNDFSRFFKNTDEAGQFYSEALSVNIGHRDTGNSVAAGPAIDRVQVELDYRDVFGGGPFLDSTDDLTARVLMDVENAIDACELRQRIMLAWDVQTIEGGRASFGRP